MLKSFWDDRSNMLLKLIVYPGKFILYIQHWKTGGEVWVQPSITLCGFEILSFGSVLSFSMCLWVWGGAPWTVNISQAREGRRLRCVLHNLSVCQTHYRSQLPLLPSISHFYCSFFLTDIFSLSFHILHLTFLSCFDFDVLLFLSEMAVNPVLNSVS